MCLNVKKKKWKKEENQIKLDGDISGYSTDIPFSESHPTSASYHKTMVSEEKWILDINEGLSVPHKSTSTFMHKHLTN